MIENADRYLLENIDKKADIMRKLVSNRPDKVNFTGEVYYISNSGSNRNDGMTKDTPFADTSALDTLKLKPGDEVLFERGGRWRGGFHAMPGVRYAAYGIGDKPEIFGSPFDGAQTGSWSEVCPNVYRYSERLSHDCGIIVLNHGEYHTLKMTINYSREEPFENVSGKPFSSYRDLDSDLTFWHDMGGPNHEAPSDNPECGYIYFCSLEGSPEKRFSSIEFLPRKNVIQITGDGIKIENLCIKYGGAHGIGSGTANDLYVAGCEIGWIGGGLQYYKAGNPVRFGNGIEIYGGCRNYTIESCYIYQIYDAGVTHQFSSGKSNNIHMENVLYKNNFIEYCTYSIEYFCGGGDDASVERDMKDIYFTGNLLRFAGYGFGRQRPDKTSPAHIKGWNHANKLVGEFVIDHNIMDRSRYMMIHSGTGDDSWNPVYRDNIFVQNEQGSFGRHGAAPTELIKYESDDIYKLCETKKASMSVNMLESNRFYMVKNDSGAAEA